ncbi:MAG: leucine-rich repeat protein [Lachnospiraceae bacterium]|nr:leucine-rich repeat protein [Lachnospiraceae bacterium]
MKNYTGDIKNSSENDAYISKEVREHCKKLVINQGVTSVGSTVFYGCEKLTKVEFPDSITSIGKGAFYNSGLTNVLIPKNVVNIGESAFRHCEALSSAEISAVSIGEYAFANCDNLEEITFSDSVSSVDSSAFFDCKGLKNVTIPSNIKSIGEFMFFRCTNLKQVIINDGVKTIGHSAFANTGLTDVIIPKSVDKVGDDAFRDCLDLKSASISAATIDDYAFRRCKNLSNLLLSNNVQSIGSNVFADCTSLTDVTIPGSLTISEGWVFRNCTSLKTVKLCDGVKVIGPQFFYGASLSSIEIPKSVTIMMGAFQGCTLRDVYYDGSEKDWNKISKRENESLENAVIHFREKDTSVSGTDESGVKVQGVTLSKNTLILELEQTTTLSAIVSPSDATNKAVTWKSSKASVASVSAKGIVKGNKVGTATITVTTKDGGKKATCKVTVKPVSVKSVKLNKKTATIKKGKTVTLKATISPSNATNKAVAWKSSNKKIAAVNSSGKVKGIKKGTATITVTTKDGKKTAKCKVTVK